MILFTIILLTALLLIGLIVLVVSVLGGVGILIFGDVIVCVVFLALILIWLIKKKRG